jgi:salicylate hydroxylase
MSASEPVSIAIVGGGICGALLAIGLRPYSHLHVTIYEAASAFAPIGAGLTLGPNAVRALDFISPAVQACHDHATTNAATEFKHTWMQFRCGTPGLYQGEALGTVECETGHFTVHRGKFLDALLKRLPEDAIQLGKRLVRIEEPKAAGLLLHFADGTTATVDGLIGSDGVHSMVRKHLLGAEHPAASPVFAEAISYRGLIPMEIAREKLGSLAENSYVWCGKDGGMVITYPIDHGEMVNVVGARGKESWNESSNMVEVDPEEIAEEYKDWVKMPRTVIEARSQTDSRSFPLNF